MSTFLILCLVAFARAQYVIEAKEGCVDVAVTVPGPFKVLRIDQTDYNFDGEGHCLKSWDPNDSIECTLTKEEDGTYLATAHICDVEDHVWAGFRMDEYMKDNRYAFVTVYFSQGDMYANVDKNCIQPQLSSPAVIDAVGKSSVEIVCARKDTCPQGPFSTIMTASRDLCRDYGPPKCKVAMDGDIRKLKTTFRRPRGEAKSFVFCSTLDSFLSYVINWE